MSANRLDRIDSEIAKNISEIISEKIKNPAVCAMVSVTRVECSKDLKHATVFISVFSPDKEKQESTYAEVCNSSKQIRYELAHMMILRTVPELQFKRDDSMEYSAKISKLLGGLNIQPEKDEESDKS